MQMTNVYKGSESYLLFLTCFVLVSETKPIYSDHFYSVEQAKTIRNASAGFEYGFGKYRPRKTYPQVQSELGHVRL